MLTYLEFANVGPSSEMRIDFQKRLNFLAGDNGLGKSFLLDAAWWALTRTWAREMIRPHGPPAKPIISFGLEAEGGKSPEYHVPFDRTADTWRFKPGKPPKPGMVLYAQVDGGFSVWDPVRNFGRSDAKELQSGYFFSEAELWGGLRLEDSSTLCNGLIADWAFWQVANGPAFKQLRSVLEVLSPSENERIVPGDLAKISLEDSRNHPTIKTSYGRQVPLVHASAGIRRVVSIAYMLVWTWQEHLSYARLQGVEPAREIIFLVDEIEAHLHPQWQRRIVPALLAVMEKLAETGDTEELAEMPVQVVAATHSPLVLASAEAGFDAERDAVWELDLTEGRVELRKFPWRRQGDANAWLTSSVFDLKVPRSLEAEKAMVRALELIDQERPEPGEIERVDEALRRVLGDVDRFWLRWEWFRKTAGQAS